MGERPSTSSRRRIAAVTGAVALSAVALPSVVHAASTATRTRAHVVIALVGEVGVNAYQRDFAAPSLAGNPSTWLPGYPKGATPLRLHLQEPDLAKAVAADDKMWRSVKPGRLYYIPGTRFAGVVYLPSPLDRTGDVSFDSNNPTSAVQPPRPVIGNTSHGTGVAGVAAGNRYGTCPDCDLVLVAADNPEDGLAWGGEATVDRQHQQLVAR